MRNYILLFITTLTLFSCQKTFDYNIEDIPPFQGLQAPAAAEGFQLHVPPFPVPVNYEREIFIRLPIGNTETIYVNKFHALCRPGTHHMIAYGFENENDPINADIGVMRDQNLPDGRGNFAITMGSGAMYCAAQTPEFLSQLPEGVAVEIPANATIDINSHYFNLTNETLFGEVFLNLHTIPKDSVNELLVIDDMSNENALLLPPNQTTDIEHIEMFDEDVEIRQMFGHMHKRGAVFEVFKIGGANDGERLYAFADYQHPPYKFFDEPLLIRAGEGMKTMVRYENETSRTIRYGVTSEDEMGILFYSLIKR